MLVWTMTHLHTVTAGVERIIAYRDVHGRWTINGKQHLTFALGTASILDVNRHGVRVGFHFPKEVKIVR
jgi:hypothetical protein